MFASFTRLFCTIEFIRIVTKIYWILFTLLLYILKIYVLFLFYYLAVSRYYFELMIEQFHLILRWNTNLFSLQRILFCWSAYFCNVRCALKKCLKLCCVVWRRRRFSIALNRPRSTLLVQQYCFSEIDRDPYPLNALCKIHSHRHIFSQRIGDMHDKEKRNKTIAFLSFPSVLLQCVRSHHRHTVQYSQYVRLTNTSICGIRSLTNSDKHTHTSIRSETSHSKCSMEY